MRKPQARSDSPREGFVANPKSSQKLGTTQGAKPGAGIGRIAALAAILWAIEHRAELAELAYRSSDGAELDQRLMHDFGFGPDECNLIRSTPAQRMTQTSREELREELERLQTSVRAVHDRVVDYLQNEWSFIAEEEPELLRSWIDDDRILFVYKPNPQWYSTRILGLEHRMDPTQPSPVGDFGLSDEELAVQIARFQILEPRGPAHVPEGRISWIPTTAHGERPETLEQLEQM